LKGAKDEFHTAISSSLVDSLTKDLRANKSPHYQAPQNNILIRCSSTLALCIAGRHLVLHAAQMQSGETGSLFGKSRARLLSMQQKKSRSKMWRRGRSQEELKEIIEYLREPQKFQKLAPHSKVLLVDLRHRQTLLARAVAGEANVPFFSISGSDFVEMFVAWASRVRDLFEQGKKNAPASSSSTKSTLWRHRGAGLGADTTSGNRR